MARYMLRRLILTIPVVVGVSIAVFVIMRMVPGDPVTIMFGDATSIGSAASEEELERLREQLGLNDSVPVQYLKWVQRIAVGDLGNSLIDGRSVAGSILQRLPATLQLSFGALGLAIAVSIPLGIIAAVRRGGLFDKVATTIASLSVSVPAFWLALIMIIVFSVYLDLLPTGSLPDLGLFQSIIQVFKGNIDPIADWFSHSLMPVTALAFSMLAPLIQITKFSMLEVLNADYVRTAKAKGLSPRAVLTDHAFRTALIPVLTIIGLQFAYLLSGTVLIETIFRWPGIGTLGYNAMRRQDYPTIQGVILIVGLLFALVNLTVDALYAVLDPRVENE